MKRVRIIRTEEGYPEDGHGALNGRFPAGMTQHWGTLLGGVEGELSLVEYIEGNKLKRAFFPDERVEVLS